MRLLLDTHAFLWFSGDRKFLSTHALKACEDRRNIVLVSLISIWEMQIKVQLGKLKLDCQLRNLVLEQEKINGIHILPVEPHHVYAIDKLPWHHKDPFDRMLIAQAAAVGASLVTCDSAFVKYRVPVVW